MISYLFPRIYCQQCQSSFITKHVWKARIENHHSWYFFLWAHKVLIYSLVKLYLFVVVVLYLPGGHTRNVGHFIPKRTIDFSAYTKLCVQKNRYMRLLRWMLTSIKRRRDDDGRKREMLKQSLDSLQFFCLHVAAVFVWR